LNKHKITYKDQIIEYQIIRKDVKNINLSVKPSMKIIVSANEKINEKDIHDFVETKARWIYNHLKKFEETQSNKKEKAFVSGESIRYLGKQYMLIVKESPKDEMKYYQAKLFMYVTNPKNYILKKQVYNNWLKERAKIVFNEVLEKMYESISIYDVKYPKLTVRKMTARWGSCNASKNEINININLIKAPKTSIEYVMLHELVHLIHPNHSKDFYDLLGALMPNHEKRKKVLDEKIVKDL
jgi:predicted metal-dependent hydrolase